MCSRRSFQVLALSGAVALALPALAARAPISFSRDYVARLDGEPSTAMGPDGRLWSAWSYRAAGEFDIAIAVRQSDGIWEPTTFVGRRDGVDQVEPVVAVDAGGNAYVTFATRSPQRIWMTVLPTGSSAWSEPSLVSLDEAAVSPAVRIVRDRLVIAFRTARGLRVVEVPLRGASPQGIQDGPDGVDPLGNGTSELPTGGGSGPPTSPPPPSDNQEDSTN